MSDTRPNVLPFAPVATTDPKAALDASLNVAALVALKRGMRRRGWTVEVLAKKTASSYVTAWRWLSGRAQIPAKALIAVGAVANDNEEAA
ncbi:MAG TPA: hypothetical protein VGK73_06790 [Polyangiaceae bacterium]